MTGSDTHADTIRALREKAMQATIAVYKQTRGRVPVADAERLADRLASLGLDALAAIDALVAEVERERARADRAEAALREIADGTWNRGETERDKTFREFALAQRVRRKEEV